MDELIKQTRRRRSPARGQSEPEEDRDDINRVPSQRAQSPGEKMKKGWFQRQYSKQMSGNDNNHTAVVKNDDEIAIAVAAATYAVNNLDEPDRAATIASGDSSLARAKSKKEMITQQGPYNSSKPFSGQQDPSSSSSSKGMQDSGSSKDHKPRPKTDNIGDGPVKTVQRRPTLSENLSLDRTESGKAKPKQQQLQKEDKEDEALPVPLPKPKKSSTLLSPPLPPKFPATKPGNPPLFEPPSPRLPAAELPNPPPKKQVGAGDMVGGASEVDTWERDEMARIIVKHEKLNQTIATWEDDKKKEARRKLDKTEREIERRRAKALEEFRTETERIGQIAGGARAQAEERRRNEELKTREKAERIRGTGKARSNCCSCF